MSITYTINTHFCRKIRRFHLVHRPLVGHQVHFVSKIIFLTYITSFCPVFRRMLTTVRRPGNVRGRRAHGIRRFSVVPVEVTQNL